MTAYQRLAARRKQLTKNYPQFSSESERDDFHVQIINPIDQWAQREPTYNLRSVATPKSPINIFKPLDKPLQTPNSSSNSVQNIQQDIDLPNKTNLILEQKRGSVVFEDYNTLDENPLGKRDGLELRGEELSIRENVRYLLGLQTVKTNEGRWRIIEIGESVEENALTFSRILLVVWNILPRCLYSDGKLYWLLAIVLAFIVKANQSPWWLLGLYLFCIILEVGLTVVQVLGKFQFGKESDNRICKIYDREQRKWKDGTYDSLTSGDIIKLQPQDEFPCDSLLLQCSHSRLIAVSEEPTRGKYCPLTLKQTVLQHCVDIPFSGMVYLRTDTIHKHLNQWSGKIQVNNTIHNISYKNFVHRGSINHESSQLICVVLYTMCNQKLLESVQYPIPLKEKILENQFSFALLMLSVLAVGCSIIEAGINVLYSFVIPSTSLLNIGPNSTTTLTFLAKYICEFTIILPFFGKLVYLVFGLIYRKMIEKDPFFKNKLKIGDAQILHQLSQTKVLVSDIKTIFYKRQPRLKSIRVKEIVYNIGEDVDFMVPKDVELVMDCMSAAYLSCQQLEDSWQKTAILDSGRKFGISRDFSNNNVSLREGSEYLTAQLLKEHPRTDYRPFSMNFYRDQKTNRILCLMRGHSQYIIGKLYSRESQIARTIRRVEQQDLNLTQLLGKTQVSNSEFQQFITCIETGPLSKLNDLILQILRNIEILGVLVYDNPHIDEASDINKAFLEAGICHLLMCPSLSQKDYFISHMKLRFEQIKHDNVVEEACICRTNELRNQVMILNGQTIEKIREISKLDYLYRIIAGTAFTLLVNYTETQLNDFLSLLNLKGIPTCALIEDQHNLAIMKYSDVGVAVQSQDSHIDLRRYSDVVVFDIRQFLKLLFVHSRNNYMATSKLLMFLIEKSFMLFVCEFTYSFYTLCTGVDLIPPVYQYLLEVWLLSMVPGLVFLFQGDYSYNIIIKNTKLFKYSNSEFSFTGRNIAKRLTVVLIQSAAIVFVVMYSLADAIDSTGTLRGHEMTGFMVFFCVFHVCLFKLSISSEHISWHQAIVLLLSIGLYYATMAIFSSSVVASGIDVSQRNIIPSAFKGRGFLIVVVATIETATIDLLLLLNNRVFSKSHLRLEKPSKPNDKEISQQQLVVFDLPK